jgi:hypothetical protein
VLSVFSLEPLLGGTSTLPCLRPGGIEGPPMFANIKKNKGLQFNDLLFFGDFINTVQDSAGEERDVRGAVHHNDLKTFSSQNLSMGIKTTQNFMLILKLLRKMRKIC